MYQAEVSILLREFCGVLFLIYSAFVQIHFVESSFIIMGRS